MKNLLDKIEQSEGFIGMPYKDSLGKDTIGIGTLLPLSKKEARLLLKSRLNNKIVSLFKEKDFVLDFTEEKQEVLYEMVYQLGVSGLLNFKKMWKALEEKDFKTAAAEGLDSRWAKQTPNRAKKLMSILGAEDV